MISERYERNIGILTEEENERLRGAKVCVAGCGGLGGYIIEELARLGIGHITAIDGDVFCESNLNRQLFSTENRLGHSKAETAARRIKEVNSDVELRPVDCFLTAENAGSLITPEYDVVLDALDNISSRRILEEHCRRCRVPLVHGAIAGWHGQVGIIMPGESVFERLYPEGVDKGAELETGNPAFTPAIVASMQVAETLKLILGKPGALKNKLLVLDLLEHEYEIIKW